MRHWPSSSRELSVRGDKDIHMPVSFSELRNWRVLNPPIGGMSFSLFSPPPGFLGSSSSSSCRTTNRNKNEQR
eukprot:3682355-Prorocentrum_lima.AAC.1